MHGMDRLLTHMIDRWLEVLKYSICNTSISDINLSDPIASLAAHKQAQSSSSHLSGPLQKRYMTNTVQSWKFSDNSTYMYPDSSWTCDHRPSKTSEHSDIDSVVQPDLWVALGCRPTIHSLPFFRGKNRIRDWGYQWSMPKLWLCSY